MPLSDYERRVLAEIEADLGELHVARSMRRRTVTRAVLVIVALAVLAAGLCTVAVVSAPAPVAAVLTGLIGAAAATLATAMVISGRRWLPRRRR